MYSRRSVQYTGSVSFLADSSTCQKRKKRVFDIVSRPQLERAIARSPNSLAARTTYPCVPPASLVPWLWPVRAVDATQALHRNSKSCPYRRVRVVPQEPFMTESCCVAGVYATGTAIRVTKMMNVLSGVPYRPQNGPQRPRYVRFFGSCNS